MHACVLKTRKFDATETKSLTCNFEAANEWIAGESSEAAADWVVIDGRAYRVFTARTGARIATLLIHAR